MKTCVLAVIAIMLCTGLSAGEKKESKEREAIVEVIKECTNAYRAKDFQRISETFVQDETAMKIGAAKGGYFVRPGWENIAANYENNFKNNPAPITRELKKTNFIIKVYKKSAWAMHNEIQPTSHGDTSKQIIVHFLEKHNGAWKIVYMSQIFVSSYDNEN